jgi:hypothetical protein
MYGKIHQEIYDSSLISHGWLPVHIFIGMVVLSDKDGIISIDPRVLYRRLGLDEDEVSFQRFMDAITILEDPDELSNLSAQGGSRIIPLHMIDAIVGNRGWLVVNKAHYRDEGRERPIDDKKEYDKGYAAARRKYLNNNKVVEKSYEVVESSYTDTDTDTDTRKAYRATKRVPEKWKPPPQGLKFAADVGMTSEECVEQLDQFRDHEFKNARKDWDAAWRTWCRNWKKWGKDETHKRDTFDAKLARTRKAAGLD